MTNQETTDSILHLLREKELKECLEILANTLIQLGNESINLPSQGDIVENLLTHHKEHGESIGSATIMNGLTMLTWINAELYPR